MNKALLLKEDICKFADIIKEKLEYYVDFLDIPSEELKEAMKYSLLCSGKRIRPYIVATVCDSLCSDAERAYPYAAALEFIHTYSLIHDDLPCMDDDDMRRGMPTCHKVFGYAQAVLAGDALLTDAFYLASSNMFCTFEQNSLACRTLANAAGSRGMVSGQMLDVDELRCDFDLEELLAMYSLKTGRLIKCACELGIIASGKYNDKKIVADFAKYSECAGKIFQIRDDILDVISTADVLGKDVLSDEKNNKKTVLSFMSVSDAERYIEDLINEAQNSIYKYDRDGKLCELIEYFAKREK